tara:strand:- start:270 stop:482 length:213 start_codon:yes stop_codon:yes gene_type:complete
MAERVQTGGVKSFDYSKRKQRKLVDSEKSEIRQAYMRAGERKQRERRNRILMWVIIALILIGGLGWYLLN